MLKPSKFAERGFTLMELLVVISIISLLASVILVSLKSARGRARDAKRVDDMKQIVTALSLYYQDNGAYPPVNVSSQGVGQWDVSYMPGFLAELTPKYIASSPSDPTNLLDSGFSFFGPKAGSYFYAYYNYPASVASTYGCAFNSDFSVIAVRQLEDGQAPNIPKAQCGTFPSGVCAGGGITNVCRDWSNELDYSVMLVR